MLIVEPSVPGPTRHCRFVACFQSIITSEGGETVLADEQFWECFAALADDPIVDVRIGVARLVGILYGEHSGIESIPAVR